MRQDEDGAPMCRLNSLRSAADVPMATASFPASKRRAWGRGARCAVRLVRVRFECRAARARGLRRARHGGKGSVAAGVGPRPPWSILVRG